MPKPPADDTFQAMPDDVEGKLKALTIARDKQAAAMLESKQWKGIADSIRDELGELFKSEHPDKKSVVGTVNGRPVCRYSRWQMDNIQEGKLKEERPEIFDKYNKPYWRQSLTSYVE